MSEHPQHKELIDSGRYLYRWWLQTPRYGSWGSDPIWRAYLFQKGWFNHHLGLLQYWANMCYFVWPSSPFSVHINSGDFYVWKPRKTGQFFPSFRDLSVWPRGGSDMESLLYLFPFESLKNPWECNLHFISTRTLQQTIKERWKMEQFNMYFLKMRISMAMLVYHRVRCL